MPRTAHDDKVKSLSVIKRQYESGATCCIPGCCKPISDMTGPGSDSLCRAHQLKQREYNGVGRLDRPHTFHRKWVCDHCGKDVLQEVRNKFPNMEEEDPIQFNRLCRNRIIGDHKVRQADGGDDSEENLQSLCLDCNSDKTILNEDWRKAD
jgi:hypothetical protein